MAGAEFRAEFRPHDAGWKQSSTGSTNNITKVIHRVKRYLYQFKSQLNYVKHDIVFR